MKYAFQIIMLILIITTSLNAFSKKPKKPAVPQVTPIQLAIESSKEAEFAYQGEDFETAISKFYQAIEYYNQALPTSTEADSIPQQIYKVRFNIAKINNAYAFELSNQDNFDEALLKYENAIEIYKQISPESAPQDSIDFILAVLYRNTAITSRNAGEFNKAIEYYDLYLDYNPDDDSVLLQKFAIFRDDLKDENMAFDVLKEYAERKNDFNAYHRLGDLYRDKNDFTNAIIWYEKANAVKVDSNVLQKLGTIYRNPQIQQWANSNRVLETFITLNPNRDDLTTAYKLIGNNYDRLKNKPKAVEFYEKSIDLEYSEDIALYICLYYYEIKNNAKTISWANMILQQNPNNINALLFRGIARYNTQDNRGTREDFEKIKNDPKHGKTAQQYLQLLK